MSCTWRRIKREGGNANKGEQRVKKKIFPLNQSLARFFRDVNHHVINYIRHYDADRRCRRWIETQIKSPMTFPLRVVSPCYNGNGIPIEKKKEEFLCFLSVSRQCSTADSLSVSFILEYFSVRLKSIALFDNI